MGPSSQMIRRHSAFTSSSSPAPYLKHGDLVELDLHPELLVRQAFRGGHFQVVHPPQLRPVRAPPPPSTSLASHDIALTDLSPDVPYTPRTITMEINCTASTLVSSVVPETVAKLTRYSLAHDGPGEGVRRSQGPLGPRCVSLRLPTRAWSSRAAYEGWIEGGEAQAAAVRAAEDADRGASIDVLAGPVKPVRRYEST